MKGVYRRIEKRKRYRTSSHPNNAGDSVICTLECGHEKHFKASREPKHLAACTDCRSDGIVYRVTIEGKPVGIYLASSSNKARYLAFIAAKDAGITLNWSDIAAFRAYGFDAIADRIPAQGCTFEHAQHLLNQVMPQ